jgi:hypothetical protein
MIYSLLETEVRDSMAKAENFNQNGSINWDYVDADCYMSGVKKYFKDDTAYYEAWEYICDMVVNEMKEESMADAQIEMNFGNKNC